MKEFEIQDFETVSDNGEACTGCFFRNECGIAGRPEMVITLATQTSNNCLESPVIYKLKNQE